MMGHMIRNAHTGEACHLCQAVPYLYALDLPNMFSEDIVKNNGYFPWIHGYMKYNICMTSNAIFV